MAKSNFTTVYVCHMLCLFVVLTRYQLAHLLAPVTMTTFSMSDQLHSRYRLKLDQRRGEARQSCRDTWPGDVQPHRPIALTTYQPMQTQVRGVIGCQQTADQSASSTESEEAQTDQRAERLKCRNNTLLFYWFGLRRLSEEDEGHWKQRLLTSVKRTPHFC